MMKNFYFHFPFILLLVNKLFKLNENYVHQFIYIKYIHMELELNHCLEHFDFQGKINKNLRDEYKIIPLSIYKNFSENLTIDVF